MNRDKAACTFSLFFLWIGTFSRNYIKETSFVCRGKKAGFERPKRAVSKDYSMEGPALVLPAPLFLRGYSYAFFQVYYD